MKIKKLVFLSIFLSIAGFLLMALFLVQPVAEELTETRVQKVEVLIASSNIESGRVFSSSSFEWKSVDKSELNKLVSYIARDSFDIQSLHGSVINGDFKKGRIISSDDFIFPDNGGYLSLVLKEGYRAVSVPVDQVTASSGLIGPGDWVDLVLIASKEEELRTNNNDTQDLYVKTILEKVKVLAFNDAVRHDKYLEVQKGNKGFVPDDSAVTLQVSALEANKIILAKQLGTLSMVLRNSHEEKAQLGANRVNINNIAPELKVVSPDHGLIEFRAQKKSLIGQ
ncbi:Flp pilus assembly protein CpaB [Vibrio sp. Of7-15]|uniref:Flp pilus assembly protein CpaB n=1 Tax=Vibrio sp. Of7-15 TaxID=2724879 RepID=UPI001EF358AD|nr:Flp pilus assembly protein CpaB [Vibrio sp. Of7-15]MCG7496159.1 Flp pilus assembly protein CpaB [Vibrio sp. Of7-15]